MMCWAPLALSLISGGAPVAAPAGTLRGVLFAAEHGRPLRHATVRALSLAGVPVSKPQRVDRDGAFHLRVAAGRCRLQVVAEDGTRSESAPMVVAAGSTSEALLRVPAGGGKALTRAEAPKVARPASRPTSQPSRTFELRGEILAFVGGAPIYGARIFVRGRSLEARSDAQGRFLLRVPHGRGQRTVSQARYSSEEREIEVEGPRKDLNIALQPAAVRLDDYLVTAPRIEGNTFELMAERQKTRAVTEIVGAQQFAESGASTAASALSRVTGVTLVGGKYVYVRGLGERYSATLLDGSSLPSPEPERRVVPLDMFPASSLESIVVQKTYSPDMPGEFGGGVVKLRSRVFPRRLLAKVSLSGGGTAGVTLSEGLSYEGGSTDWLGFGAGARALPSEVLRASNTKLAESDLFNDYYSAAELERFGELMPNKWALSRQRVRPDMGASITLGNSFSLRGGRRLGVLAAASYANGFTAQSRLLRVLKVADEEGSLARQHEYDFEIVDNNITLAGLLNLGLELGKRHTLRSTTLIDRIANSEARAYEGYNDDVQTDIRVNRLTWVERMLLVQQLRGEHQLLQRKRGLLRSVALDWRYALSLATRLEPDRREARFDRELGASDRWLLSDRPEGNERFFSELFDLNNDLGVNLKLGVGQMQLAFGLAGQWKSREVDTRRFKFQNKGPLSGDPTVISQSAEQIFTPENIGVDGFQLQELTRETDNYEATQRVLGAYLMSRVPLPARLELSGGLRLEQGTQRVKTFELFNPDNTPIIAELENVDLLPAALLSFSQSEKMVWRLGYSRTLSRPDLRELSPAAANPVTGGRMIVGNKDLQRGVIHNVDLRWEWYFSRGQLLSVSGFYKRFVDPIETVVILGAQQAVSWENATGANNLGAEIELRMGLGPIARALRDVTFAANAALIHSRVDLSGASVQGQTSSERALQGQSPWVLNLQLGYRNPDRGTTATLLYNVAGPRIASVGAQGAPDIFREPVHQLDLVVAQDVGRGFSLGLKAQNLIDAAVRYEQGGQLTERYRVGRRVSVSLAKRF